MTGVEPRTRGMGSVLLEKCCWSPEHRRLLGFSRGLAPECRTGVSDYGRSNCNDASLDQGDLLSCRLVKGVLKEWTDRFFTMSALSLTC